MDARCETTHILELDGRRYTQTQGSVRAQSSVTSDVRDETRESERLEAMRCALTAVRARPETIFLDLALRLT